MATSYVWARIAQIEARQERFLIRQKLQKTLSYRWLPLNLDPLQGLKFTFLPCTIKFNDQLQCIWLVEIPKEHPTFIKLIISPDLCLGPRTEVFVYHSSKLLKPILNAILYEHSHCKVNLTTIHTY